MSPPAPLTAHRLALDAADARCLSLTTALADLNRSLDALRPFADAERYSSHVRAAAGRASAETHYLVGVLEAELTAAREEEAFQARAWVKRMRVEETP